MKLIPDTGKSTKFDKELNTPSVSREIKDGVFRLLFDNPVNAAELYYALTGIACSPDDIQIIPLSTAISGKLKNDLAFIVKGKAMVVGEHQSTPSKNMPVRFLLYVGRLYEKWVDMRKSKGLIYGNTLYKIPTPEFVVFYNGIADRPDREILKLSDAFELEMNEDFGSLELKVPVYNINKGMNIELFAKSEKLRHYSEFISKIREFQKIYDDYTRAVEEAVSHCIEHGILEDFLREHGGVIVSILFTEYDEEVAKRVYAEEYHEERLEKVATKMLMRGTPIGVVVEDTGLSESIVRRLMERLRKDSNS